MSDILKLRGENNPYSYLYNAIYSSGQFKNETFDSKQGSHLTKCGGSKENFP
jgi:hypothetical protein